MTKNEMQTKIDSLEEDIKYYEKLVESGIKRVEKNIQYIDENLKNEKNESKKKLLNGLKNEFLSIKSLLNDETVF